MAKRKRSQSSKFVPEEAYIPSTTNYGVFEELVVNRRVDKLDALRESMIEFGFNPALHVIVNLGDNNMLVLKDGHHRLAVARSLGLPVYYVMDATGMDITLINRLNKPWDLRAYLNVYKERGIESYIELYNYQAKTGIPIGTCISLLCNHTMGSSRLTEMFKDGKFRPTFRWHANDVGKIIIGCADIGIEFARNSHFVQAISMAARVGGFTEGRLLTQIKKYRSMMIMQPNTEAYLKLLQDVYNYKRPRTSKISLKFEAEMKAAHESQAKRKRNNRIKGSLFD